MTDAQYRELALLFQKAWNNTTNQWTTPEDYTAFRNALIHAAPEIMAELKRIRTARSFNK